MGFFFFFTKMFTEVAALSLIKEYFLTVSSRTEGKKPTFCWI